MNRLYNFTGSTYTPYLGWQGERSLQDLEVSYTNDTKWHEPDATMKSEKDEDSDEFKPIPSTNLTTASGDVMEIKVSVALKR